MPDDLAITPTVLLAQAAANDARMATEALARLANPRLLEVVLSQATLAVEPGRPRTAGIDAIAELDRASVELMGARSGVPADQGDRSLLTGWELLSVGGASDLVGATTAVPARPWHLALLAFCDVQLLDRIERRVTAATADMRFVTAVLRIEHDQPEPVVVDATVTDRLDDLGADAALAWGLWCALASAAEAR